MMPREIGLPRGLQEFLAEAEETLDDLGRDLATLAGMPRSDTAPPDLINAIFRGAHSLKGLAGMLGLAEISGLAHHLETLLDLIRLGKIPLDNHVIDVLFAALDALGGLVRTCGQEERSLGFSPVLERLVACSSRAVTTPSRGPQRPSIPERIATALTEFEEHRLSETVRRGGRLHLVHASFPLESFDRDLEALLDRLKTDGEVISTLPSPGRDRPDTIEFDILFAAESPPDALHSAVTIEELAVPAAPAASAPERREDASLNPVVTARSISGTVRVDIGKLDELMAVVGELIAVHASLQEGIEQVRNILPSAAAGLLKTTGRLGKKLHELQDGVMDIRLVPLRSLYDKLARIVRKISEHEGRSLTLELNGADTRLDKQIVEDISDPLMHLVRNAVDHGIESPEERAAAGKDVSGRITISAIQKGTGVVIEVADDGRGIDLVRVRSKAVEKGIARTAADLSDEEAMALIFEPGFSTSDVVSELSGRGVGMDVVMNNITDLSGTVVVESQPGTGSRFVITLPVTLAIIRTLIIDAGDETYGVPISAIQETVSVTAGDLLPLERDDVLPVRDMTLPVVYLDRFFGRTVAQRRQYSGYAIVAGSASRRVGIMADGIRGQQDLVLKSLGVLLGNVRGISGAADLGEERTILVLDVAGIIDEVYRGGGIRVP